MNAIEGCDSINDAVIKTEYSTILYMCKKKLNASSSAFGYVKRRGG